MEIYIVAHYYDNGEMGEDRQDYVDHFYFSSYEAAVSRYYDNTLGYYEGKYTLSVVTLDTQERETLKESSYEPCNEYEPYFEDNDFGYEYYGYDNYYEPNNESPQWSKENIWKYIDEEEKYSELEASEEEERLIDEYLTTPHETYEIFKEIEEDRQRKLLEEIKRIRELKRKMLEKTLEKENENK